MSYNLINLVTGNWSEVDPVWLFFAAAMLAIILYFVFRWVRSSSRGYNDSADDHAKSCLEAMGWGCMVPLTVMVVIVSVAFV